MSASIRRTKSSLKCSKTCHDALLLGLSQPKDLCRNCKNYFDLPVKKKPQSEMGVVFSRCERPQMNGISPASSSTEETGKRKAVYCQLASTPAPTKRVLLLSSTCEAKPPGGGPSIQSSIEATRAHYSNLVREKEEDKSRLQEELERTQKGNWYALKRSAVSWNVITPDLRTTREDQMSASKTTRKSTGAATPCGIPTFLERTLSKWRNWRCRSGSRCC